MARTDPNLAAEGEVASPLGGRLLARHAQVLQLPRGPREELLKLLEINPGLHGSWPIPNGSAVGDWPHRRRLGPVNK